MKATTVLSIVRATKVYNVSVDSDFVRRKVGVRQTVSEGTRGALDGGSGVIRHSTHGFEEGVSEFEGGMVGGIGTRG